MLPEWPLPKERLLWTKAFVACEFITYFPFVDEATNFLESDGVPKVPRMRNGVPGLGAEAT